MTVHSRARLLVVVAGAVGMLCAAQARAGTEPNPWELARTPGEGHATLAELAGDFELTATFWPEPGASADVSILPARRELLLGGRALRLEVGPDPGGFRGHGLMGFDNVDGAFWYVWTDTSTTGLTRLSGRLDGGGSGLLEGPTPTPFGAVPLRVEIRFEGGVEIHDHYVPAADGGEHRMLELRYRRVGG